MKWTCIRGGHRLPLGDTCVPVIGTVSNIPFHLVPFTGAFVVSPERRPGRSTEPDEGDIGERKANRIAKRHGSANPEGNVRDKGPATNGGPAW